MGLFTTVLHIYKKNQQDIVDALTKEFSLLGLSGFKKLSDFNGAIFADGPGVYYLITSPHGNWITIVELKVSIDNPFYLFELTTKLSSRLKTFALSFHLHDDDVLYYDLDHHGNHLDGYTSDYQYFLDAPAPKDEILSQRHDPKEFSKLLPTGKDSNSLNSILNEGYWNAFDNNALDENGVPNDDKYFLDELERFERIGKYLEIYSPNEYPFANWYDNIDKLDLGHSYLLFASR